MSKPKDVNYIFEHYGVHNLTDETHLIECRKIAKRIYEAINSRSFKFNRRNKYTLIGINPIEGKQILNNNLSRIEIATDFDWLYAIDIYISFDNKEKKCSPMLLDNTVVYSLKKEGGESIFTPTDTEVYLKDNNTGEKNVPCVRAKDKIIKGSIFIPLTDDFIKTEKHIFFVVLHEVSHMFDLYKQKINNGALNRDKLPTAAIDHFNNDLLNEQQRYLSLYIRDVNIPLEQKKELFKKDKVNHLVLSDIISKLLYALNISELHAWLTNYIEELSQHNSVEFKNLIEDNKTVRGEKMCKLSETFKFYWVNTQLFKMMKNTLSVKIKQLFYEYILTDFLNKDDAVKNNKLLKTNINPYVFGRTFISNIKTPEQCVDEFFDFLIKRIDRYFLRHALNISLDITTILNNGSNAYMFRESLYPDYFGNLNEMDAYNEKIKNSYYTIFY